MNSPYDLPFNVYRRHGHFEYGVDERDERQWLFEWARNLGVRIEHTGGRNEGLSMDSLQVCNLPVSSASAFANRPLNRACPSCNTRLRPWSNEPRERDERVAGSASELDVVTLGVTS